jgi:hypothetical protein
MNDLIDKIGNARLLQDRTQEWYQNIAVPANAAAPFLVAQEQLARMTQDRSSPLLAYAERMAEHLDNQRRIDYQVSIAAAVTLVAALLTFIVHFL